MKKVFKTIHTGDPDRFVRQMEDASAAGWAIEACGATSVSHHWAIMSRPSQMEGLLVTALTEKELELARTLADCSLNVAWAAREMHVRRATADTRIKALHDRTGLNPLNFYDLNELLYMEVESDEHGNG